MRDSLVTPGRSSPALATVIVLWLGAVLAAAVLDAAGALEVLPVGGSPTGTVVLAGIFGLAGLRVLSRIGWYGVGGGTPRGYLLAGLAGVVLTFPVIGLDVLGGFPREMNVPAPAALLAYPAIALVAEFLFHAVPLALVGILAHLLWEAREPARRLAVAVAALPEPVLQVIWGASGSPTWATLYVGPHLLAFNLLGLALFRRYGFLTVVLFRLAYYAVWHVAWGHFRLTVGLAH